MKIAAPFLDDPAARAVCDALQGAGHRVWYVGGCVRNALMGLDISDLDLTTDALPDQVIAAADTAGLASVPTGIAHGTVTVIADGRPHEVTTLRRDVATDGRHAEVAFGGTLEQDARRRDFTINALYATPVGDLVDPLGGLADIRARRIRFINDPAARIREDYLRILRFFRFTAYYADPAGGIDTDGLAACAAHLDGIDRLSRERVGAEMRKLLSAADPAPAMAAMVASGVLMRVLPGADTGALAVLTHVEGAAALAPDWLRRLALIGGEDPEDRLRLSRAEATRLTLLRDHIGSDANAAELGYRLGSGPAADVLALRAAFGGHEIAPNTLAAARHGAAQALPLRAADLMPAISGPALGLALKDLEARWVASGFALTRAELLALAGST